MLETFEWGGTLYPEIFRSLKVCYPEEKYAFISLWWRVTVFSVHNSGSKGSESNESKRTHMFKFSGGPAAADAVSGIREYC